MKVNNRKVTKIIYRTDDGREMIYRVLSRKGYNPSSIEVDRFCEWRIQHDWELFKNERQTSLMEEKKYLESIPFRFHNAKQGEKYELEVPIDASRYESILFEGLEPTGLEYDPETRLISGVPEVTGDFVITLRAKLNGWRYGDPVFERKFNLGINADPRKIWRDLPVPEDIPFPKADTDSCLIKGERAVVAASKRGRSHAHEAKPRDDDFSISFNPDNGWYILAVADGAGSARFSREGSRIACKTVQEVCSEQLNEYGIDFNNAITAYAASRATDDLKPVVEAIHNILYKAAFDAHKAIQRKADETDGAAMRDFHTTLLLTICRKFDFGWFFASFGVGDGAIAIYDRDAESIKLLNDPDGGQYGGETRFLTMSSIFSDKVRYKMTIVPDFSAMFMMTDGVSDPEFETDANLLKKDKWDGLWDNLNNSIDFAADDIDKQFLDWLDFWSPGNHDDRTIALMY